MVLNTTLERLGRSLGQEHQVLGFENYNMVLESTCLVVIDVS